MWVFVQVPSMRTSGPIPSWKMGEKVCSIWEESFCYAARVGFKLNCRKGLRLCMQWRVLRNVRA